MAGHEPRMIGGEHGSATVWAIVWVMLLVWLAQLGLLLGWVVARQHQVDAAADLAALSAAAHLQRGTPACATARAVAAANRADLRSCHVEGMDVDVEVAAAVELPLGLEVVLHGVARAGP